MFVNKRIIPIALLSLVRGIEKSRSPDNSILTDFRAEEVPDHPGRVSWGDLQSSLSNSKGSIEALTKELVWFRNELENILNEESALSDQARRSLEITDLLTLYESLAAEDSESIDSPSDSATIDQFLETSSASQRMSLSLDDFVADFDRVFKQPSLSTVLELKRRIEDDFFEEKSLRDMHLEKNKQVASVLIDNLDKTQRAIDELLGKEPRDM